MRRRAFLSLLGVGLAGYALDPDRALWVPGRKTYFVLPPQMKIPIGNVVLWDAQRGCWSLASWQGDGHSPMGVVAGYQRHGMLVVQVRGAVKVKLAAGNGIVPAFINSADPYGCGGYHSVLDEKGNLYSVGPWRA